MNLYQKKDWLKLQALKGAEAMLTKKRNIFLDCGLRDAADRAMNELSDNLRKQREVEEKMNRDRKILTRELVKVFLIAYLAYSKALDFEDLVRELTDSQEDALSGDMVNMVKACEEMALAIDKGCGTRIALVFGELSDQLEDWFKEETEKKLNDIIFSCINFDKIF